MTDKIDDIIAGLTETQERLMQNPYCHPDLPLITNPAHVGLERCGFEKSLQSLCKKGLLTEYFTFAREYELTPVGQQVRTRLQEQSHDA